MAVNNDDGRFVPPEGTPPPGIGRVKVEGDTATGLDHFAAWGAALDEALANIQGSDGTFRKKVSFTATVTVTNPGVIIEYHAIVDNH